MELVLFEIGQGRFALRAAAVGKVLDALPITPLPYAPRDVEGLINVAGSVLLKVDLALRLGLTARSTDPEGNLLVIMTGAESVGVQVDRVFNKVTLDDADIHFHQSSDRQDMIIGEFTLQDQMILLVNERALGLQDMQPEGVPEGGGGMAGALGCGVLVEQARRQLSSVSWADYDAKLISAGGGIFLRSAKSIAISPQMKERFDISADKLAPNELLNALLKAPVDLLWNGGIGTYVKSSKESHADVGDKANDLLRVDGRELRAKVVGEGGNLGMTQLGRVEYGLNGGKSNTDFIDNAGGVDCSDHEVNIKILLGEIVGAGDMTGKQRNKLLVEMTDAVGGLVLGNNYKQTQALSLAERRARERVSEYKRLMTALEAAGKLDRALEFLPTDDELNERAANGLGLTRPELSVLISYSKIDLKESLLKSLVPDDEYLAREMETAFPPLLAKKFGEPMRRHRLKREIVSTQIANDLVNHMGITFVQRLRESTGMSAANVAGAYVIVRDLFRLPHWWKQIEALDYQVPAELQLQLMDELMRLGRRATRWFLRSRRNELDAARDVAHFAPRIEALVGRLDELLEGPAREQWLARFQGYVEAGVPEELARVVAGTSHLYTLLPIIEASDVTGQEPARVAAAYFAIGGSLELSWYLQQITSLPVENNWQALAREAFRDDLDWQQRAITVSVLQMAEGPADIEERVGVWLDQHRRLVDRWKVMLGELRAATNTDYAMYAVANRELMDLAQSA